MHAHEHAHGYRHSMECPARANGGATCTCIIPRFRTVFLVAITFAGIEWVAGWMIGSGALRGDAWHLAGDSVTDLAAWTLAAASAQSAFPHLWHRWGTVVQAIMLATAGGLVLFETLVVGHHAQINGYSLAAVGITAFIVNYWRFRIMHPGGGILPLLHELLRALWRREKVPAYFVGEVLHIVCDMCASVAVVIEGVFIVFGSDASVDVTTGVVIATLTFTSAIVTLLFAHPDHH